MSLATLMPSLRAAVRERLLTCVDVSHSPGVSVSLASGVFTRVSGSWLDAGLAAGQELTVTGFTGSPLIGQVTAVAALTLTTEITGASQTVAGGGAFLVKLPGVAAPTTGIAWEGVSFRPTAGKPYVSESYRPVASRGRSVGGGLIEHATAASFTLFYPAERGTLAIERMAGALMAHFKRGTTLQRSSDTAVIEQISRSALFMDGGWLSTTVSADLLSWTQD